MLPLIEETVLAIAVGIVISQKVPFTGLTMAVLFGTCLSPLVTEVFLLPFSNMVNLLIAVALGIFIGFLLPPLSMHTASMHVECVVLMTKV